MSKEIFRNYPSKVEDIMKDVISGRLGLPDLQRPFVWSDNKVRDLLDSMMKGFPIGYIMIWDAPDDYDNAKSIGDTTKVISKPKDLVIDGQQRITSLLSAIYGIKIIDVKYRKRPIRISFNPVSRAFEVWTAATEKDQNWISDISTAFKADEEHCLSKFRRQVYSDIDSSRVKKGLEPLTEEEKDAIENNIKDLLDLKKYTIPVMEILSDAQEDDVSEIFRWPEAERTELYRNPVGCLRQRGTRQNQRFLSRQPQTCTWHLIQSCHRRYACPPHSRCCWPWIPSCPLALRLHDHAW